MFNLQHLFCRHESYQHPSVVFQPLTTLMSIDHDFALFSVCDVDVHKHTVGPFFYINQFNHCRKLIQVPLKHFIRLMKETEEQRKEQMDFNLILLSNTGRCGSTLLTQLFEKLPGTVSISEPEALMPFAAQHDLFAKADSKHKRTEVLRACITALCVSSAFQVCELQLP